MKKIILNPVFISLILLTSSCKVEFTRTLRKQIEAKKLDIKKIQYYNSKKIILKRVLSSEETKVASGEITLEKGQYIEIVEIKKNTPGVCDKIYPDRLQIKFEEGEGKYLVFEEQIYTGSYQMKSDRWDRNKAILRIDTISAFETFRGMLNYDGKKYYTNSYIVKPRLMVKKKETVKTVTKKRQAKGVIVN